VFNLPLPWVQAWLLNQVWRYLFSPDEASKASRLAWTVSFVNSLLYLCVIAGWLPDAETHRYVMMVSIGLLTTCIGIAAGVIAARRRHFTDVFTRNLALATGLLSLIPPVGIALTPFKFAWPIILTLIVGFILYRRAMQRYLDKFEARATLWQLDRLTLEIVGLYVLFIVPFSVMALLIFPQGGVFGVLAAPFIGVGVASVYSRWRGKNFVVKKKASPLDLHRTPLFADDEWSDTLLGQTIRWCGAAIAFAITFAFTQDAFNFFLSHLRIFDW
jgi:hypothetical protein